MNEQLSPPYSNTPFYVIYSFSLRLFYLYFQNNILHHQVVNKKYFYVVQHFHTAYACTFIFTKQARRVAMKHNIKQTYTQKTEELKLAAGFENISVFSANEPVLLFIRLEAIF